MLFIIGIAGLPSHRRRPLSSNVRRRNQKVSALKQNLRRALRCTQPQDISAQRWLPHQVQDEPSSPELQMVRTSNYMGGYERKPAVWFSFRVNHSPALRPAQYLSEPSRTCQWLALRAAVLRRAVSLRVAAAAVMVTIRRQVQAAAKKSSRSSFKRVRKTRSPCVLRTCIHASPLPHLRSAA